VSEWVYDPAPLKEGKNTRIAKGGSYRDHPLFSRCTFRDYRDAHEEAPEIGFRCCTSLH
jgi:formylglycine-generating enzyme required for sulfatase activity